MNGDQMASKVTRSDRPLDPTPLRVVRSTVHIATPASTEPPASRRTIRRPANRLVEVLVEDRVESPRP